MLGIGIGLTSVATLGPPRAVAGSPPTVVAVGTVAAVSAGSASVPLPTWQAGDVAVLAVGTANEVVATPAGWTALAAYGVGTAGAASASRISLFWRRLETGDTNPSISASIDHAVGAIVTLRGCKTSGSPVTAEAGSALNVTAGVATTLDAVTVANANSLIVYAAAQASDSAAARWSGQTHAGLGSLTERVDGGTALGGGGGLAIWTGVAAAAGSLAGMTATCAQGGNQGRAAAVIAAAPFLGWINDSDSLTDATMLGD
jgi:hypothetical protein